MKNTITICLLFLGFLTQAQSLSVEVSGDSILLGNVITLKFTVENSEANLELPEFEDMQIVSGPNYASSVQIFNGEKTSQKSISLILRPKSIGQYFIPPAYLVTEDITLETEVLEINVYPNPEGIIEEPVMNNTFIFESFTWPETIPFDQKAKKPAKTKSKNKLKKI